MFAGSIGRGMADASVAGNVFASPPTQIYEAAKAAHGKAVVLFLYGNYSGGLSSILTWLRDAGARKHLL
jgi:dihydroxyacetone kinase-like protein